MNNTDYLYFHQVEVGILWGILLLVVLVLNLILFLSGKMPKKVLRTLLVSFLLTTLALGASLALNVRSAKNHETVTTEAVFISSDGPMIPLIKPLHYQTYSFYSLEDGEDVELDIHDKRADLVEGNIDFQKEHIYRITYAAEPVWEILAVEDTGRAITDPDSSIKQKVLVRTASEEYDFDQYDVFYYGKESKLMKTWVEEIRYPKTDGWTKEDVGTLEDDYPGIEDLDFVSTEFIETDDHYITVLTAVELDQLKHMKALERVGFIGIGAEDRSVCNVNLWMNIMKDDGFRTMSKEAAEKRDLHFWDGTPLTKKGEIFKQRIPISSAAETA